MSTYLSFVSTLAKMPVKWKFKYPKRGIAYRYMYEIDSEDIEACDENKRSIYINDLDWDRTKWFNCDGMYLDDSIKAIQIIVTHHKLTPKKNTFRIYHVCADDMIVKKGYCYKSFN